MINHSTILAALFSVYSALLFGYLCSPEKVNPKLRFHLWQEIPCDQDTDDLIYTAFAAWIFIVLWLVFYIGKEAVILSIQPKKYFSKGSNHYIQTFYLYPLLSVNKKPYKKSQNGSK